MELRQLEKPKPRLLLFRSIRANLPPFILQHFEDQEDCLRQSFNLHVISDIDCDLDRLCDLHQPELLMFESGVYAGKRTIRNYHTHQHIPRIGFCNSDAYCAARSIFLSDMDRWGVETFFTHSISMPSYTTEIADRLFLWPNSVNPKRFSFQRQPKCTTVLLTGSRAPHYPWRNAISRILSERFPVANSPHFGWFDANAAGTMVMGDAYVQQLAQSIFVPACGSIAREAVRKHFEIPAAGACLIAEKTPALEAAGFVDMENCIFADQSDVVDKVSYLLDHPPELECIVEAGKNLVHLRHTIRKRTQVADWLALHKQRREGQRIQQRDPFGKLELVANDSLSDPSCFSSGSEQITIIRSGMVDVGRNDLMAARAKFTRSNNWRFTTEAALGMALASIRDGRPRVAMEWIWRILDNDLSMNALEPEPVVWATLIRAWLCMGKLNEARRHSQVIPWVNHHELDRMRNLVAHLSNLPPPARSTLPQRATVHALEKLAIEEWRSRLAADMRKCGQFQLSDQMASLSLDAFPENVSIDSITTPTELADSTLRQIEALRRAHKRSLGAVAARLEMRISGPPSRRLFPMAKRWAMKRLGIQESGLVRKSADLAATADYAQVVLHTPATTILADAVLSGAAQNPNLRFTNPVANSIFQSVNGARIFLILGEDQCDSVDLPLLMERAEVLVLDGTPTRKSRKFISDLLAAGLFDRLEFDINPRGAIFRRRAEEKPGTFTSSLLPVFENG